MTRGWYDQSEFAMVQNVIILSGSPRRHCQGRIGSACTCRRVELLTSLRKRQLDLLAGAEGVSRHKAIPWAYRRLLAPNP